MNEAKIKHLEFIQNIINRMNTNSFQIKTFTIVILSALLSIYATNQNYHFFMIAIIANLLFWCLDSYYLQQERKFRGIYNRIIDASTDNTIKDFDMPIDMFKNGHYSYHQSFFSKTIVLFYGIISIFLIALTFVDYAINIPQCIKC